MTNATCSVQGCERPRFKREFCSMHYRRWNKYGTVEPQRSCLRAGCSRELRGTQQLCDDHRSECVEAGCSRRRSGRSSRCKGHKNYGGARISARPGHKVCRNCRSEKPTDEFYRTRTTRDGLQDRCKTCFAEYRFANRERMQQWRERNAERLRLYAVSMNSRSRERSRQRQAHLRSTQTRFEPEALLGRLSMFGNKCWICRGVATEVDHVKPVAAGGLHILANLRPICLPCNRWKNKRWPLTSLDVKEIQRRATTHGR